MKPWKNSWPSACCYKLRGKKAGMKTWHQLLCGTSLYSCSCEHTESTRTVKVNSIENTSEPAHSVWWYWMSARVGKPISTIKIKKYYNFNDKTSSLWSTFTLAISPINRGVCLFVFFHWNTIAQSLFSKVA